MEEIGFNHLVPPTPVYNVIMKPARALIQYKYVILPV